MSNSLYNVPNSTVCAKVTSTQNRNNVSPTKNTLAARTGVPSKSGKPTWQSFSIRKVPVPSIPNSPPAKK